MKKVFRAILFGLMAFALSACGTDNPETSVTSTSEQTASETESASSAATEDQEEVENAVRRMQTRFGDRLDAAFAAEPDSTYYGNVHVRGR